MMRRRIDPSLCLVAMVALAGAAYAAPKRAVAPAEAPSASTVNPAFAYQYNTSNWAYASSSDAYRAVARADPQLEGLTRTLSARIFMAYNLASLGRTGEAAAALDEAQAVIAEHEQGLQPFDRRLLSVDLLIGRSVVQGAVAARGAGEARAAAFDRAAQFAGQAAVLAAAPVGQPAAEGRSGDIEIDPNAALAFNDARGGLMSGVVARGMADEEKLAELEGRARYSEAAARLALGDNAAASAANLKAAAALNRLPTGFAFWLRALVEDQSAELQLRAGDARAAERTLLRALATTRRSHGLSRPEAYLWRRLGRVRERLGDVAGQRDAEERSFAILVAQADSAPPTRQEVASYQALLAPLAVAGKPDDVAKFFLVSSLAVETETAATIADVAVRLSSGAGASAVAIRRLQDARRELDVATTRVTRVHDASPPAPKPQVIMAEDDLDRVQAEVAAAGVAARREAGSKADAVTSPATGLAQVQAVLGADEAYLRFVFLDDGAGYLILVRKSSAKVVPIEVREADLKAMVADLRGATRAVRAPNGELTLPSYKLSLAASLYRTLFGGVDPDIAPVKRLVIEPAGPLFSLPFGALLVRPPDRAVLDRWIASRGQDYRGAPWLAREKSVQLSVGSAGFVRLRGVRPSNAAHALLAFADPVPTPDPLRAAADIGHERESRSLIFVSDPGAAPTARADVCAREAREILNFPALPDTRGEAASAARALGEDPAVSVVAGSAFTDEGVKTRKDLNGYRLLLFATHAALPNQAECWPDPFLITTKGSGAASEGVLETSDIAALDLNADVVVLSACNTGAGNSSGQALGGLAQSFFFAGSRGLIVSHWSVDSRATAALVTGVFARIGRKIPAGEALSEAEVQLMDDPALSHPYYWAAFTMVGGGASQ